MKFRLAVSAFALAIAAVTATQSHAQVLWSAVGSGCVPETVGETLALINPVYGTVSFAANKAGDIHLSCPVPFLNNTYGPVDPGILGLTYYNDHGFDGNVNHCYVSAAFLRSNLNVELGNTISEISAINKHTNGRQVIYGGVQESLDFQNNYYWVDVWMHRDSATATCDPVIVGTFLQAQPIQ